MFKEIYFTHVTSNGITYEARPMPKEFIGSNGIKSSGTPIRVYMIDINEERKFKEFPNEIGIFMSDEGKQGYVGYYDYYIESDNSVTSGMFYVHPFHRNRGLVKDLITFLETINEGDIVYNSLSFGSPYVAQVVSEVESASINNIINR